jgi:hypothetical protein
MAKFGNVIYERVGDIVYSRDFGDIDRYMTPKSQKIFNDTQAQLREDKLWGEIRRAAKSNSTLQSALEQCIIIYKLSKEYKDGI